MRELIIEPVEKCKLVHEGSRENGHDCWGNFEWTSYQYVWIDNKKVETWNDWFIIHDGKEVIKSTVLHCLPKFEYQEQVPWAAYGWTPSTEKDYKNPKEGIEYRMLVTDEKYL